MDGWRSSDVAAAAGQPLGRAADTHHVHTAPTSSAQGAAFMFQRRRVPINWRHLAGLDVDRVCREVDIQALQQNISNVTFCNIESEEFHGVDGNFIKLFRLAQLTIEYLLHSQQYLTQQKSQTEQQLQQLQKEIEVCHNEASARTEEVKTLKRENRKRRKIIEAYQDMLNHGATGLHPCPVCSKEFVSQQYLDSHIQRRHPHHLQHTTSKQASSQEEMERRLMEQMNEKFQAAEQQLRLELARKESDSLQNQAREFEQWKHAQQEKREAELEAVQAPLLVKLRSVEQEKEHLHRVLQQTQVEMEALRKRSHHTQQQGSDSVDFGGEDEAVTKAATTEVKRLETKVVSKWKKHKKDVDRQMQQMNKSYQDQLLEISEKLVSMEQSMPTRSQTSPGKKSPRLQQEQKKQEEMMKKELWALQQKVTEQEQQLSSQKQQLESLQTQEPPTSPSAASNWHAERAMPIESQSEVSESSDGEEEEEEEEFPDSPHFNPFSNRTNITTLFHHEPEAIEKIRRETVSILDNALLQRGVTKGTVGMSEAQFGDKMKLLETERQQRIQMHSQFMEQREQLVQEVDSSATTNCRFRPPQDLFPSPPTPSSSPRRAPPSPSSPSPRQASPRLPSQPTSPRREGSPHDSLPHPGRTTQRPSPTSGIVSSKPPTGLPPAQPAVRSQSTGAHVVRQLQTDLGDSESETGSETESQSDSYEEDDADTGGARAKETPAGAVRVLPFSGGGGVRGRGGGGMGGGGRGGGVGEETFKVPAGAVRVLPFSGGGGRVGEGGGRGGQEEDDMSPWDSEDSNDHLTTQDLRSVPTSTPVQAMSDSWEVTETTIDSPPHSKRTVVKKVATNSADKPQSVPAAVSCGDFDDSLSDISTTHLT